MKDFDFEYSSTGQPVKWLSPVPTHCDVCNAPITDTFIDGKTKQGPWGCLCLQCFTLGPGINRLGTGYGQKYVKQTNGDWLKTEG